MSRIKAQTEKVLPCAMRDNKPRTHAVIIRNSRPDDLPDGVHCGAWLDLKTHKVWKCLYGRPYYNSETIVRTKEDEFLDKFGDLPLFPRNWEVKPSNHLWWLVRDEAMVLEKKNYEELDNDTILQVEQTIYKVNRAGWSINDYITLLLDKYTYDLFIGDLSCAFPDNQANDWLHIERFFRLCGREHFNVLRQNARTILHNLHFKPEYKKLYENGASYNHVYASFNRPISGMWASLGNALYIHEPQPNWGHKEMIPWSWVITQDELPQDKVKAYELTWGWSRLQ